MGGGALKMCGGFIWEGREGVRRVLHLGRGDRGDGWVGCGALKMCGGVHLGGEGGDERGSQNVCRGSFGRGVVWTDYKETRCEGVHLGGRGGGCVLKDKIASSMQCVPYAEVAQNSV